MDVEAVMSIAIESVIICDEIIIIDETLIHEALDSFVNNFGVSSTIPIPVDSVATIREYGFNINRHERFFIVNFSFTMNFNRGNTVANFC